MKNLMIKFVILYSSCLFTPCYGLKKEIWVEAELVRNVVQALNNVVDKKNINISVFQLPLYECLL